MKLSCIRPVWFYLAPLASFLAERFGYRAVAITGSVLAAGGFLGSSYATSIDTLIVLHGLVAGKY